jgi:hypothetical protein
MRNKFQWCNAAQGGTASPIRGRRGLFYSGICLRIHQFRRVRLFATSSVPVPGTGSPCKGALISSEIEGSLNFRLTGHCRRTSFRVWTKSPARSL